MIERMFWRKRVDSWGVRVFTACMEAFCGLVS